MNTLSTVKGAGNSASTIRYEYTDVKPFISYTYYRLSQVDYDGEKETFDVIAIQNESQIFYTYSKSGDNNIYLSSPSNFELYNMMGQIVRNGNEDVVYTEGLPQGIYVLKIGLYTQKFFIR